MPDPYRQYASPYKAMGNNPSSVTDPDGGCADDDTPCILAAIDAGFTSYEDIAAFQNLEGLGVEANRMPSSQRLVAKIDNPTPTSFNEIIDYLDPKVRFQISGLPSGSSDNLKEKVPEGARIIPVPAPIFKLFRRLGSIGRDRSKPKNNADQAKNYRESAKQGAKASEVLFGNSKKQSEYHKAASSYPAYDRSKSLPDWANSAGTSRVKSNPDSLIQRRLYFDGVIMEIDTLLDID